MGSGMFIGAHPRHCIYTMRRGFLSDGEFLVLDSIREDFLPAAK